MEGEGKKDFFRVAQTTTAPTMNSSLEERLLASKEEAVSLMESARCEISEGQAMAAGNAELNGSELTKKAPLRRSRRLQSLDVARGVTIALMIFVDYVGDSWEYIDHTPWDGVRLADFVMPSFDLIVGFAVAFSMRHGRLKAERGAQEAAGLHRAAAANTDDDVAARIGAGLASELSEAAAAAAALDLRAKKWAMLRAAMWRAGKLFLLGVWTQSGTDWPTLDLKQFRVMGILQRVALCYAITAAAEILLPEVQVSSSFTRNRHLKLLAMRAYHWLLMAALVGLWCALVYGVQVPNDGFFAFDAHHQHHHQHLNQSASGEGSDDPYEASPYPCERGSLAPQCNAAAWIDGLILGKRHMYFPHNGGSCSGKVKTDFPGTIGIGI